MSSIGERIKNLRTKKELTLDEVGKYIGVNRATVQRYESGKIPGIPSDKIELLANLFSVSPAYIMGWSDDIMQYDVLPIQKKRIPLLGKIAAGTPIDTEQHIEGYFLLDDNLKVDFALQVQGDSMINDGIDNGDIVFIRQQPDVENGEMAAVYVDGSATLKRVYKVDNAIELWSANPKYRPMIFRSDNCDEIKILGKAIAVTKPIR